MPIPEHSSITKPQRVLACVLCQQRKVKCNRQFPCVNCVRSGVQCVPAASLTPRQRRRRFPERELLDRLRHYEDLLSQNHIAFDPLHSSPAEHLTPNEDGRITRSMNDTPATSTGAEVYPKSQGEAGVKSEPANLWRALSRRTLDSEEESDDSDGVHSDDGSDWLRSGADTRKRLMGKAWDRTYDSKTNDHVVFGSPETNEDLTTQHPEQVQIFRLWQLYLENVDPLLKVTHAPTLQVRIIEAATKISSISPTLEALMFSIYCVSILSVDEEDCVSMFDTSKKDLLSRYRFGCRQALHNCNVFRSSNFDCLTALYLYLISVRPEMDPRSLSSMLGIAIRLAKRIGIHSESSNAKCTPFEAEIRRRLWWSLVIFDNRVCEMFDSQNSTLSPTWDCKSPMNVNDFELRLEMKVSPTNHENSSEALFVVVRSEMNDFIRHSTVHLEFVNPSLRDMAGRLRQRATLEADDLDSLEKRLEDKYLAFCNPEIPLQFMTIWTARNQISKAHLLEYYSTQSKTDVHQTSAQRNVTISHAMRMLESDTKLMKSPLTKGYRWLVDFYFPFPAYMHILQNQESTTSSEAESLWKIMSDNYEVRIAHINETLRDSPLLILFSRKILKAWKAQQDSLAKQAKPSEPPPIVLDIMRRSKLTAPLSVQPGDTETHADSSGIRAGDMDAISIGLEPLHNNQFQDFTGMGYGGVIDMLGQTSVDMDLDHFDWTTVDWNSLPQSGYWC